jgi:hypothetical protein
MSDSVTKWHEMQEEAKAKEIIVADESAKYIFLLDFNDGKAYRYDISALCTDENKWNPDNESCEAFLYGAGHQVNNCEWMVTNQEFIQRGN